MKYELRSLLALPAIISFAVLPCVADGPIGTVGYLLQMGGAAHQTYQWVFSGTVTKHGKACAGAHVEVELLGANDQNLAQAVDSDNDGHYMATMKLEGAPEQLSSWKVTAKAGQSSLIDPVQLEGHVILMDETTVLVERPLQIAENL
jgi:hypothetical protein